mgnify:FL=1
MLDAEDHGGMHSFRMMLFGLPQVVTVVTPVRVAVRPRQHVVALGSLIDDPATRIEGYHGTDASVVWCGLNPIAATHP